MSLEEQRMNKRIPIAVGMLIVLIALWVLITPTHFIRALVERLDNLGYDLQLSARALIKPDQTQNPIAIVDIDDTSIKQEGRWPWPRSKVAELVNALQQQGAAVLAFDIFFSEAQDNIGNQVLKTVSAKENIPEIVTDFFRKHQTLFDEDALLAESLKNSTSVLAISFLPRAEKQNILPAPTLNLSVKEMAQLDFYNALGYISNIPNIQNVVKNGGFINIYPDSDGIIRRAALLYRYQNNLYPSLALQSVLLYLDEKISLLNADYSGKLTLEGVQLGNRMITTDERAQVLIPFYGKSYTFPYYSATELMHGKIPKETLSGKIVFIGTSATGLGDLHATAIENPFPGVEIQATLAEALIKNNFAYKPAWVMGVNFVLTLVLGLIAAISFAYFGPRILSAIIIIGPSILLYINYAVWNETGIILSFLIPTILIVVLAVWNMIYGYLFETRKREHLKEMFGQYVPAKHIDEMLQTSGNYGLRGEDREMSVLFADIRSFTTISEGLSAAELVNMLNTFFTPMTEIIFKYRGTIDKYVGDLIMAFWGAPLKDRNHASHAMHAALKMQLKVKELQAELAQHKWPEIKIGIGINSGLMSVGDMGSQYRLNYTVLGDSVNLASRVESLTKFYGVEIIVTEFTAHNQTRFEFRKLDRVKVKGKKAGVIIYELLGFKAETTSSQLEELKLYHAALELYYQQQWEKAEEILQNLQTQEPRRIYQLYLERIAEFKKSPPTHDWNGLYEHKEK